MRRNFALGLIVVFSIAISADALAHGGFVYVPSFQRITYKIMSSWVVRDDHPYVIWQANSVRPAADDLDINANAAVDVGPMYPTQAYRIKQDIHKSDGSIYITAGTPFAKMNGGSVPKYGYATKYCSWNINNSGWPMGRFIVKLFTPPKAQGSYNAMVCVELDNKDQVQKIHELRSDNLALLTETKDSFLYGSPDLQQDKSIEFEKIDEKTWRTNGNVIAKVITLSLEPIDPKQDLGKKACLNEMIAILPPTPPSIKVDQKCFGKIGDTLEVFDGAYKLTAINPTSARISLLKPFSSPRITPKID